MEKVLLTGGTGFIGSHTLVELLEKGYEVAVADNLCNSCEEALRRVKKITGKNFKFYNADIRDRAAMEEIFSENKFDSVIHFAGLKAVGESCRMPLEYYDNNICGTLVLLETMRAHNVKKIVLAISAHQDDIEFMAYAPIAECFGKADKKFNLRSEHFTFYETYFDAMKLLKGGDLGAFVKAICAYMFRGEVVQFKDKEIQGYYNLCKLKMDISKKRKSCGSRGGKAKCGTIKIEAGAKQETDKQPVTSQYMPKITPVEEQPESKEGMTYERFRSAYPDIQYIYENNFWRDRVVTRKEDTPQRVANRKYEAKNKQKRQAASGNFQTMIPRDLFDEINAFLKERNMSNGFV